MKLFSPALLVILLLTSSLFKPASGQTKLDSLFRSGDSTAVMDSLMKDFDLFLDSLLMPRSFLSASLGIGTGIFSFQDKSSIYLSTEKKLIVMPALGYYHKTGLGISASAYAISDKGKFNIYEYSITPSYDVIRKKFSTGIAYSRYFNKDSLDFYTTPIQNELFAYFSWKDWWVRPGISASYGWGSKSSYKKQKYKIWSRLLQQSRSYFVTVKNYESVEDISLTVSVRKDFDWYDVLGHDDNVTLTPVLLLNSGTQNFGFNTSYTMNRGSQVTINSLPSNSAISESSNFALQSLSAVLRGSYLKGNLLVQPQVYFDYALWDTETRFNIVYSLLVAVSIH